MLEAFIYIIFIIALWVCIWIPVDYLIDKYYVPSSDEKKKEDLFDRFD